MFRTKPKITAQIIFKLIIACLLVGLVLLTVNINPRNILESGQDAIYWLIGVGGEYFGWALTYILIGAVVVMPIWSILYMVKAARGRE